MVKQKSEEGRVTVRNIRRNARQELEAMQKDGDLSTDELERVEKDLEKITQDHVAAIDRLLAHKEQELLEESHDVPDGRSGDETGPTGNRR